MAGAHPGVLRLRGGKAVGSREKVKRNRPPKGGRAARLEHQEHQEAKEHTQTKHEPNPYPVGTSTRITGTLLFHDFNFSLYLAHCVHLIEADTYMSLI